MIKFEKEEFGDRWTLHLGKSAFIHTVNDWEQLFGKWNWYTFNIIQFYIEKDDMLPGWEVEVALLGLGLRFRWNDEEAIKKSEAGQRIEDFKKQVENGTVKGKSVDEIEGSVG